MSMSMPKSHWQAMNKQSPSWPGMKLSTKKLSKNKSTMNFYYK